MDPISAIGFAASIANLIDAVVKVVSYINDVKEAPRERAMLAREGAGLLALLTELRYKVEDSKTADPWFAAVRSLGVPGGPLEQFRQDMDKLSKKLKPARGLWKFGKALVWTINKGEINDIISRIERFKTLLTLARQEDHYILSLNIKSGLDELKSAWRNQKGQEQQDLLAWISDMDFSTKQYDFFARYEEGTGAWFLNHVAFQRWLNGDPGMLWCYGLRAGKTIIMSLVINHLERGVPLENIGIAYVYYNYKEQANQTAINLIASLLQQLAQRDATLSEDITSLACAHIQKRTRPTFAEWSQLLQSQISRFSRVYILVDALDEGGETRDSFLAEVRKLLPAVHLLITSRPISTIESELEGAARVEIRATDRDVKMYLERRILRERRLARLLKADASLEGSIVKTIVDNAKGMFLLAQLQMDAVVRKHSGRDIRSALANLPRELNGTYDEAMRRIWSQGEEDVKLAEKVLSWISHVHRPLLLIEMQHALAVEPGDVCFDEGGIPDRDFVVSVCAGLVTVEKESQIIRLVHHTTQEYFEQVRMSRFPYAPVFITTTCLTYLSFDEFGVGCCQTNDELVERMRQYPFLEYAARYWGHHARGEGEEAVKELALDFLRKQSNVQSAMQVAYFTQDQFASVQPDGPPVCGVGLHMAASFGLVILIRCLLQLGDGDTDDVNCRDWLGRTPLSLAAENGHASAALQLLEHKDVDANIRDADGRTALSHAAENGHETVVRHLLQRNDVDINTRDRYYGQTPLWQAADRGHAVVVQLLLQRADLNPNSKDKTYGHTPLWRAADRGHGGVVRLLLQRADLNVNAEDKYYKRTPLWQASDRGHEAIAQLLLNE